MTGHFALDCTSLAKSGDQHVEALSVVCDGLRGDVRRGTRSWFDLCEIVDGTPQGIDTLIRHLRGKGFSHDGARIQRIIPTILPTWRTLVQTKRGEHEAVCLAETLLLDTLDSDGPSNTSQ